MDFHSMVAEMADIPRKSAKVLNLALMYGMGVAKMSNQLDVSLEEAKELTAQYHERVPFVKKTMDIVSQTLQDNKRNGYIVSILGRKLRFNLFEPTSFGVHKAMGYEEARAHYGDHTALKRAYTYKALNRLIQASAADMTKKAMSDLYNEHKIIPLLQIHDELAVSVKDESQAKSIANIMENTVQLKVPMKTDLEIGLSWGEAK
jgi:DNA polymerase-1